MNIKEAISLIEQAFGAWESEYCCSNEEKKSLNNELKQVIETVKRGKAYEAMWEEFKKKIKESDLYYIDITADDTVNEIVTSIQQKYFPKGGKR